MLVSVFVALTLPTAAAVIYLSLRPLWTAGGDVRGEALPRTYRGIAIRTVMFVLALQTLILLNILGGDWLRPVAPRAVVVLFGVFLVAIGDALPRTRPNLFFGIRTARTLEDRQFWMRLHRVAGYLLVASGAAMAIAACVFAKNGIARVAATAALVSAGTLATVYVTGLRARQDISTEAVWRWREVALWTLRVLLAIAFFYFGITKFPGSGMWVRMFERIGLGQWFRIFTGFVEMAARCSCWCRAAASPRPCCLAPP
jgi:uncharacterized membrane protein